MTASSGDAGKHAGNAAPAIRSLPMTGNRIESRDLFAAEREIIIAHAIGLLSVAFCSQNKLILTK
jgi:hemin uptake protein HemP